MTNASDTNDTSGTGDGSDRRRWWALILLCLGELMIVLDTTIVNIALPSIRTDLHFSDSALVWVVNAYMLTFGGSLLLAGRLGDLYGHRRLFMAGLAAFTLASLACGLAGSPALLIAARAVQGVGGAIVSAVALSLMMTLFTHPAERTRAMGIYGFVCAGGGSLGVLLGGLLTDVLSWHWVFLVNLPIGLLVGLPSRILLPPDRPPRQRPALDLAGAASITAALMLGVYAIVNGNEVGWGSVATIGQLAVAVTLLLAFVLIERRVAAPLMPLTILRIRSVAVSNVIAVLWAAAMFAWFFISALYMQRVLGYSPMQVGLAFLPANVIMAAFSLGLSARLVMRFGLRRPLWAGLLMATLGLVLFGVAPVDGLFVPHVLPGMLLLGLGAGVAFNPMLMAAMNDVDPADAGLASGIVNTSFMMGGALGLAMLASLAAGRTDALQLTGATQAASLTGGYGVALLAGAACAGLAALGAASQLRDQRMPMSMRTG